jgi:hypothetical protein
MASQPIQGLELQLRIRARVRRTAEGKALLFGFQLGPMHIFCICNMPEPNNELNATSPLVYIKATLTPTPEWELLRERILENTGGG